MTDQLLGRDKAFFGYLLSSLSAGNVLGSLFVARQVEVSPRMVYRLRVALAAMLFLGGISTNTALTMGAVAVLGFASTSFVNSTTVILQQRSSEQMRSRILALSAVLFLGSTPIGGPITGVVGDTFGAEWSMLYGAIICEGAALGGALLAERAARSSIPGTR